MIFIVIFVGGYCLCGITFQILSFKYLDKRIKYFEACTNISSLQYEFKNIKSLIGLMSFQGFFTRKSYDKYTERIEKHFIEVHNKEQQKIKKQQEN